MTISPPHATGVITLSLKVMLLFTVLLFPAVVRCQETMLHRPLIEKLVEYRSHLIDDNREAINRLRQLEQKWKSFDVDSEEFEDLAADIVISKLIYQHTNKRILKDIHIYHRKSAVRDSITDKDIEILVDNFEVLDLIFDGILKPKYPYVLLTDSYFLNELAFYDIKENEKIGEVGAGNGSFSFILGMSNKNLDISINELNSGAVDYISLKVNRQQAFFGQSKLAAISGSKTSTNFPAGVYDKIIVRNAFHHFSKKGQMLASIRNSLKPDGVLFISEPIKELNRGKGACSKILPKNTILKHLAKNGFRLEEERRSGYWVLLKFIPG